MNSFEIESLKSSGFTIPAHMRSEFIFHINFLQGTRYGPEAVANHPTVATEVIAELPAIAAQDEQLRYFNRKSLVSFGAAEKRREQETQPPSVETGYTNSIETVYMGVAGSLIWKGGLEVLTAAQGHLEEDTMPSWAIDWRVPARWTNLAYLPMSSYRAGGKVEGQNFSFTENGPFKKALKICAFTLGRIKELGVCCDLEDPNWLDVIFEQWWSCFDNSSADTSRWDAFLHTVCIDADREYNSYHNGFRRGRSDTVAALKATLSTGSDKAIEEVLKHLRLSCRGRKLFVTDTSQAGLAPDDSRVGDTVCIPLGVKVPFVLRRYTDHFSFIGDCFATNCMKGEILSSSHACRKFYPYPTDFSMW